MSEKPSTNYVRRHLAFGWWSLLLFLAVGIGLEAMHAFKVSWYLNVGMETRRLMWRLAHAHGAFLSLVHIAFAFSLHVLSATERVSVEEPTPQKKRKGKASQPKVAAKGPAAWHQWASRCLFGASVGLPGGFFLGGVVIRGGDPGLGVILLPIGAVLLLIAVLLIALNAMSRPSS